MAKQRGMSRVGLPAGSPLRVTALAIPSGKAAAVQARVRAAKSSGPKLNEVHHQRVAGHTRSVGPGRMVLVGGYTRGR